LRLSNQAAGWAQRLRALGSQEWLVAFHPPAVSRRRTVGLPPELTARLLRYQIPGFRPSWLLTSLRDADAYPRAELLALYHRRWAIETIYREWKHGLDIQNLRSHTPAGIRKEIHAQLLLSNLVRWLMTEAAEGSRDTPLDFSFLNALTSVKTALLTMLRTTPARLGFIHQQLLHDIRRARIRKRPGRSYPRPADGKIKNKGHGKYQLPTKLKEA
jgi:hypothetical protein